MLWKFLQTVGLILFFLGTAMLVILGVVYSTLSPNQIIGSVILASLLIGIGINMVIFSYLSFVRKGREAQENPPMTQRHRRKKGPQPKE